ncbi:MAG: hypothetical protein R6U98_22855 [Pirellulaceae bacterium]
MESCPAQTVLPLVGLAADKVIRDRYSTRGRTEGGHRGPVAHAENGPPYSVSFPTGLGNGSGITAVFFGGVALAERAARRVPSPKNGDRERSQCAGRFEGTLNCEVILERALAIFLRGDT